MSIVSSNFITEHAQKDGRRDVIETHIDHLGTQYIFEYLWDGVADRDAILVARAASLLETLAIIEYTQRLQIDGWTPLQHQTGAEFADKLRAEYRVSSRERVCYLAWWLINRITEGTFTDAQVRNAFSMTTVAYTSFKARLQAAHDHWAAVITAQGE
jgi:hypothetical protein